ncbi:MAG: hypothetical protein LBP59_09810 [Planctomycetaceae bacterium]|nr:hypothetical protein [Planctomycetaceae bacterium]
MSEVYISTAFLFAYRQSAGETPAIRWSRLLFRIAGEVISQQSFCFDGEVLTDFSVYIKFLKFCFSEFELRLESAILCVCNFCNKNLTE